MSTNSEETIVLIDGHALAYRAFFGMPPTFVTSTGEATHAVFGFINMLLAVWKEHQSQIMIVAFDRGKTFRHELYEDYKATREKMPSELHRQIHRIEQLLAAFNIPMISQEGVEADDILGTLATQATAVEGLQVLIVSGDRDLLQLVGPQVKVATSGRNLSQRVLYDLAAVQERYGLQPAQLVDLKALVGDTSDNIPGVEGIGEKTAIKLLQKYQDLEGIYSHLSQLSEAVRHKLEAERERAFLSRQLGRIITDVPGIVLDLNQGRLADFNMVELANLLAELEFYSLLDRIPGVSSNQLKVSEVRGPTAPDGTYTTIDTPQKLSELVTRLKGVSHLAIETETDSSDEMRANLVGLALSPREKEGYYIPVASISDQNQEDGLQISLFETDPVSSTDLTLGIVRSSLGPILADPKVTKYLHNAKFDIVVLTRHDLLLQPPIFDTMLTEWVSNNAPDARYGLKELARQKLNIQMTPIEDIIGRGQKQISLSQVPIEQVTPYAGADVDMTLRLAHRQQTDLQDEAVWTILQELELPLIYVLRDMQLSGIKLDIEALAQMSVSMSHQLNELEQRIFEEAGGTSFNLNSTQQLSDVLFERLKLPTTSLRKTKSGHYSTAADVLTALTHLHPIIPLIQEHRSLTKLKSTYVDALPALVDPRTGRLSTTYNQIGISTGRLSSSNPNLQNIPIRTEQGREIRRAL